MRAFVTGSRAYGTPRTDQFSAVQSDIDLVCLVSSEDMEVVLSAAQLSHGGSGNGHNVSLRFGLLNLILLSDYRDYELWKDGTEDLKERKPVTREQAVRTFQALRIQREAPRLQIQGNGMPVSVSLYDLARVPGGDAVLPDELRKLISPLELQPEDKTRWGVIADWLDEHDEPVLAAAFRYVSKRPIDVLRSKVARKEEVYWSFSNVPPAVQVYYTTYGFVFGTLLGATAALAHALVRARTETE